MIHIQEIHKQFGSKIIFINASAQIHHRSKTALIGPNGAGKSTLIKMILGHESPDEGMISKANHLAIGYLSQDLPKSENRNVLEEVMRLDGRREELYLAKSELEKKFEQTTSEVDLERYGRILEELEHLDEYRLESRAKTILAGMGFQSSDFQRNLSEFSGGWLMRVALSRILLMDPDLLLLDEPTNHLDLESQLWLEEFLLQFKGAIVLISHDTAFLNRIVTEVIEIDQKKLISYKGNLESYALQKEERLNVLKSQYEGQQAKIAQIQAFVSRFGAKASKAKQAQSRLKQLEKMERIELTQDKSNVRFRFPPAPHSGKEIVQLKKASFLYGEKIIFHQLDWTIPRGSRTAIVGVNGAGKTTLLKILSGKFQPNSGEIKFGHEVKIGYYAQLQAESLNQQNTILQELEAIAPHLPITQVRGIAGAFLFSSDAVDKKCAVLSGGEKARVALAKLLLSPSNFLILDEPTNHLDVESRGVLLDALEDFQGTLCIVSHDRDFISPLVDSVLEIIPSPNGSTVNHLIYSYEEYLAKKINEANASLKQSKESEGTNSTKINREKNKGPSNNQKKAWEKERLDLEKNISALENEQKAIHQLISHPQTYENKENAMKIMEQQKNIDRELAWSLARWEELCLLLDR